MNIVYICNEYPPFPHGGIGSFTYDMANGMSRLGHKVTVVGIYSNIDSDSFEVQNDIRIVRLRGSSAQGLPGFIDAWKLTRYLYQIVKENKVDLIEGPESSFWLYSYKFPKVRLIRMNGGHTFFRATLGLKPKVSRYLIEKMSFANASHICAVSNFVANETTTLLKLKKPNIQIIPNFVNTDQYSPKYDICEKEGQIIFIGSLTEKKGIRQLIQAMPKIIQAVPTAHLIVVGRDTHDTNTGKSYQQSLQKDIPENLTNKIDFIGAIEHSLIPEYIAGASVCVYPSHMEALPIAWLEGMAMSKLVIASRTGPGPEVIRDNVDGLLCDPFDPDSIAEKIILALQNKLIRIKLGEEARNRILREFSLTTVLLKNENYYNQIICPIKY